MKTVSITSKIKTPSFVKFEALTKREKQQLLLAVAPIKLAKKWDMTYGETCALLRGYGLNLIRARVVREKAERTAKTAMPDKIKVWKVRPNTPFNKSTRPREEMRGLLFSMPVADLANKTGYTHSGILNNAKNARIKAPNGLYWRMVKEGWIDHVNGAYLPESVWRKRLNDGWKTKMVSENMLNTSMDTVTHEKSVEKYVLVESEVRTPGRIEHVANGDIIGVFMNKFFKKN